MTSQASLSLSLLLTKVTHAQYRKRFRASYNRNSRPVHILECSRRRGDPGMVGKGVLACCITFWHHIYIVDCGYLRLPADIVHFLKGECWAKGGFSRLWTDFDAVFYVNATDEFRMVLGGQPTPCFFFLQQYSRKAIFDRDRAKHVRWGKRETRFNPLRAIHTWIRCTRRICLHEKGWISICQVWQ